MKNEPPFLQLHTFQCCNLRRDCNIAQCYEFFAFEYQYKFKYSGVPTGVLKVHHQSFICSNETWPVSVETSYTSEPLSNSNQECLIRKQLLLYKNVNVIVLNDYCKTI